MLTLAPTGYASPLRDPVPSGSRPASVGGLVLGSHPSGVPKRWNIVPSCASLRTFTRTARRCLVRCARRGDDEPAAVERGGNPATPVVCWRPHTHRPGRRSEEHTSELQSL